MKELQAKILLKADSDTLNRLLNQVISMEQDIQGLRGHAQLSNTLNNITSNGSGAQINQKSIIDQLSENFLQTF